jgi:hypothetical protein
LSEPEAHNLSEPEFAEFTEWNGFVECERFCRGVACPVNTVATRIPHIDGCVARIDIAQGRAGPAPTRRHIGLPVCVTVQRDNATRRCGKYGAYAIRFHNVTPILIFLA